MNVTIIIPVYNEKHLIATLLDRVLHADAGPFAKEIIVVDDGSTDGTGAELRRLAGDHPVRIVSHSQNRGKAAAIRSALTTATGDIILIQDADLEYSPDDYRQLLMPFLRNDASVVYGSRFLGVPRPRDMTLPNRIANKLFTRLVNLLYRVRLTDEGTAYKVFRREVLASVDIRCSGFEFCPEVTAKILKRHIPIIEVPVSYAARSRKQGKKPGILDGLKILWTIIKYRLTE